MTLKSKGRTLLAAALAATVVTPMTGCGPTRRDAPERTHGVDEHPRPVKG